MRMRNKPWALEYLSTVPQVIFTPVDFKGQWKKQLNIQDLHVEIGSGKGDYCIKMATMFPNSGWIAIERDKNVSTVALKKVNEKLPENMLWIVGEASSLEEWFATGEIDVLHLNFSDPWPKSGHYKRRLTSPEFVPGYLRLLSDTGNLKIKTDNKILFEYTLMELNGYPLILDEVSVDFRRNPHPDDAISEYEQKFMDLGQPIYRCVWRKKHETQ